MSRVTTLPAPRDSVTFFVAGEPVAQGNHRVSRYGAVYESTKGHRGWRRVVETMALLACREACGPFVVPVVVEYAFYLTPPKKCRRRLPSVRPDCSKLVRLVEDAMTKARLLSDDSIIVRMVAAKFYATAEEPCGVRVTITHAEPSA